MRPNQNTIGAIVFSVFALAASAFPAIAATIPAQLPAPDGKPGDPARPVKVYILAGQSNMVGMGELSGAKCAYTGVYLSSDPETPTGPHDLPQVGKFKFAPLAVFQPDGKPARAPLAQGLIEVPEHGVYQVQCGSGKNPIQSMEVDGKPVCGVSKGGERLAVEFTLEPGKRYPFSISGSDGEAPRFWLRKMDLLGKGDLETTVKRDGMFPWLADPSGKWNARQDVFIRDARLNPEGKGAPLIPTCNNNGKSVGPELGFGHVMGTYHDETVLIIKTAIGNRSLSADFRPPSSGKIDPKSEWESLEYRLMIEGVHNTLAHIDQHVPGYKGQGYEIAGFVWWQGHKDSFAEETIAEYEKNLVNLINDLRKEFKAPKMPVVIGGLGFGGHNIQEKFRRIMEAQMAVGDPAKHPEFAGSVASVDTRDFWREVDESPKSEDYHYNRNAETYLRAGDAFGRAMVGLLGGKAEPLPQPPRPQVAAKNTSEELTAEQQAAVWKQLTPIILDGIIPAFIADPAKQATLATEAKGERPKQTDQILRGAMDGVISAYNAAGIHDYDWKIFGKDLRDLEWESFSFDPAETLPKEKRPRYRTVTPPTGMENWISTDFDAAKAGWKKSMPPFGQLDGKLAPLRTCELGVCGCGKMPRTLWEKEVLLTRGTFDIPPLKDDHRYRFVVGGSAHVLSG
ncbi:MAG: sialate O-acetylesterase, partial [Verrucomicrobiota bacterium]